MKMNLTAGSWIISLASQEVNRGCLQLPERGFASSEREVVRFSYISIL